MENSQMFQTVKVKRSRGTGAYRVNVNLAIFMILALWMGGCSGGGGGGNGDDTGNGPTYTVSGAMFVEANTEVDSDVNDPFAAYTTNDDFATAQSLRNPPVVLGGYVNVTGSGAAGRFYDPADSGVLGDTRDYYSVRIEKDQTILLRISDDDASTDLNLYLYEGVSPNSQVQASVGTESTESISVTETADYIVEVRAASGASNYTLTIGQNVGTTSHLSKLTGGEFVHGEAIVKLKEYTNSPHRAMDSDRLKAMGFEIKSGQPGHPFLLRFDNSAQKSQVFRSLGLTSPRDSESQSSASEAEGIAGLETLQVIRALNEREDVDYAEPNYIVRPYAEPDDRFYSLQWHYPFIHLPEAWDVTNGSQDVIVAVIDTGVLMAHPDLSGKLVSGYDFISDVRSARDNDGIDSDPNDPGDSDVGQSSFHGTHVSGTIAAATGNADGVAGVGWNVKVMPLRALGQEGGTIADLVEAIKYAARLENASGTLPDRKADIINLSIGHYGFSSAEKAAIDLALAEGVIVVAAAGNESTSALSYPAAYDGVISVSAVNIQGRLASYSNFGSTIHVAAPGGDTGDLNNDGYIDAILSTGGDDSQSYSDPNADPELTYAFMAGTSMASPHVAGVLALMKSLEPNLSPAMVDAYLAGGNLTFDMGGSGFDSQFGHGLIDAQKAVSAVQTSPPTILVVGPTQVFLDADDDTAALIVDRLGDDAINVISVTDDSTWLTVADDSVDADGIGTYSVSINRNNLPGTGTFSAQITFQSSINTVVVPVTVTSVKADANANAGLHYIQILDYDLLSSGVGNPLVKQAEVEVNNGLYTYAFSGIPAGRYVIFGSSDLDNDLYLTDPGEAFGAYSSWQQPVVITVDSNISGLDFSTGFKINLPASQTMYSPLQAIIENEPQLMMRVE